MRVLVLGADGMLGHQVMRTLNERGLIILGTVRKRASDDYYEIFNINLYNVVFNIDITNTDSLITVIEEFKPDFVINCIGYVKQTTYHDLARMIHLNALFPHILSDICKKFKSKLLHISTDCVYNGLRGDYLESDAPDALDTYGKSKALGEVSGPHVLTIRTSIIGHEIFNKYSLLEWFLRQEKTVTGYKRAIFSGFTTNEMSIIIYRILHFGFKSDSVYHISSVPISKFDLLEIVNRIYQRNLTIVGNYDFTCDRSLKSTRFKLDYDYTPPTWTSMVQQMYLEWRLENE